MNKIVELVARGHDCGALAMHPYFGRMDPALASLLVQEFSLPGDRVLDPFCGSGTVLHEAILLGRSVTGWDSSPLATMISTAKLAGITSDVATEIDAFVQGITPYATASDLLQWEIPEREVPPMPRVQSVSKWFGANALKELAFLRGELLESTVGPHTRLLLRVAFSRCIIRASRQKGESSYTAIEKPDDPGRVVRLFLGSVRSVVAAATAFTGLRGGGCAELEKRQGETYRVAWPESVATLENRDSRHAADGNSEESLYDLVVTSPPYLMSWDYGLYHKFRFYWLDLDLDAYEDTEVGRHLRRRRDDVVRYRSDMCAAFVGLASKVKRGGTVAMVNAPSAVYGTFVDTNRILVEVGESSGFDLEWQGASIGIPGPHHGMYASLASRRATAAGQSGKREHVLILRRR